MKYPPIYDYIPQLGVLKIVGVGEFNIRRED